MKRFIETQQQDYRVEKVEDNEHKDMENPDEGGLIPRRQGNQRGDLEFCDDLHQQTTEKLETELRN